ncbi:DUF6230 family protein [Thermomonospora umbrina]|uniref:Cholesterol esterase n=1 Tax=Thermomonospora umbrina TaxID=111806 RepID=A0A3D9SYK9_9ACTN|nr:DUF6230 family protein [Thermomonospora umbrina]REF01040.1 hypothetical protein DFJ69_6638 [Thermomonospora umbrina]
MEEAIKTDQTEEAATTGRTRWGRFGAVTVPAAGVVVGLGIALSQGLLAASFATTNQPFEIESTALTNGNGFGAIMDQVGTGSNGDKAVARAGFTSANLNALCAAANQSILGVDWTLQINSSNPAIAAQNLVLDGEAVQGDATMSNVAMGKSADLVTSTPGGAAGNFGLTAGDGVTLNQLHAKAYAATIAGTLTLPGLRLSVATGKNPCTLVP